jgi:hypothetical protein
MPRVVSQRVRASQGIQNIKLEILNWRAELNRQRIGKALAKTRCRIDVRIIRSLIRLIGQYHASRESSGKAAKIIGEHLSSTRGSETTWASGPIFEIEGYRLDCGRETSTGKE